MNKYAVFDKFFSVRQKQKMGPCNDYTRRPQRVASVLELDFRKGFCDSDFSMLLGSDGCHSTDGDGLTVNSSLYQVTQPHGPNGWLDHHKWCAYHRTPVECHRSKETLFEAKIANKQIFNESVPFPSEFRASVSDMYADPRLAHGQFCVIDPESGIQAGFMVTDHMLYAVYGRRPAYTICKYKNCYADECEPCAGSCDTNFGCNDFWTDCRYQDFKQNTTEPQFRIFFEFTAWCHFVEQNDLKLNNFKVFCSWRKQNPTNCDMFTRQDYVAWKSQFNWQEYCCFLKGWKEWHHQYKDWEACSESCLPVTCEGGDCSSKLFGGLEKKKTGGCSCYHMYTRDGRNCYDGETTRDIEQYPYQFSAGRSCCNPVPASFVDMVPLMRTEACDPLCDFIKVAVGIDRKYKCLKFYVNNQQVFKVVDIGRRLNDMYRVIEHGGYAEAVDVRCVLLAFGTGSMLDASMPNNYHRYHRAKGLHSDETGLVPLMPADSYKSIYHNKLGEMRHVESTHFAVSGNDLKYRAFMQGDVFKIQYICVLVRAASRDYPSLRSYCPYSACCGPRGKNTCDTRECCDDDDDCCVGSGEHDPRDYNIEFITQGNGAGPVVGDDLIPLDEGIYNGTPRAVKAKLVRTPRSKRYWQPQCGDAVWGDNPY